MTANRLIIALVALAAVSAVAANTCAVNDNDRIDCFPRGYASQSACEARGCCWEPASEENDGMGTPWCFFPPSNGYSLSNVQSSSTGFTGTLTKTSPASPYGNDIKELSLSVDFETDNRLHMKITDASASRYEVPIDMPVHSSEAYNAASALYDVTYASNPFGLIVTRKSTGQTVWNGTLPGFTFADQFIQFSSYLPSTNIYGLGEHVSPLMLSTDWQDVPMFARDQGTPEGMTNLYGVHPMYLNVEPSGMSNAVFLLNSNAQEAILQPAPAITFRTIGGVIDLYIMLGNTPNEVIKEYHTVIGRPAMVPYWSLGFNLCRWGYGSLNRTMQVNAAVRGYKIPFDTQWNDIDYMDKYLDFTYDPVAYKGLPEFVDTLHNDYNMHYVMITDPGISNKQPAGTYPPYDDGMATGIFINASGTDNPWVGSVWPGPTTFPDFWNPKSLSYWQKQIQTFHDSVAFDGLWIDMNEPSTATVTACGKDQYTNPPYTPGIANGDLDTSTMCMDAETYLGKHYNLHSTYGYSEMVATMASLKTVLRKRTIVVSRSTYPNSGYHGSHWLGDNTSTWPDLYLSIPGLLSMNMFGIPLVGADICGFNGHTTEELCTRWMQLGAFYPFSRNHNAIGNPPQDPAAFGPVMAGRSRDALMTRYTLLPFLYSLFHQVHTMGGTVARPLFFEFVNDTNTLAIDKQFMWGEALMITPVLTQGATSVSGYFPAGAWYDYYTGERVNNGNNGGSVTLQADLDTIPLHLRGGYIIPTQQPAVTTVEARTLPHGLIASMDYSGSATGFMFTDDGDSLSTFENGEFVFVEFAASADPSGGMLTATMGHNGYTPRQGTEFSSVTIHGLLSSVSSVSANGSPVDSFHFNSSTASLSVTGLSMPVNSTWKLSWLP